MVGVFWEAQPTEDGRNCKHATLQDYLGITWNYGLRWGGVSLPNNRYEGIAGGVTIDTIKKSGTAQTPDFQIKEQSSFTVLFSLPFGK
jgi:hypothetical protein